LKPWHKEDVFNAFLHRGWKGPVTLKYPKDWHYVGEAWSFTRGKSTLELYFVSDYGVRARWPKDIESIEARVLGESELHNLWFKRERNAKWKRSVVKWADEMSAVRRVGRVSKLKQRVRRILGRG
jgi:hypothetical protein